jgi:low temperature requirement protein LtrA
MAGPNAATTTHTLAHRVIPMTGRDPEENHRAATPLELLFDLTFVVAFGFAGNEAAHAVAEAHWAAAIGGFSFAMFAVCWAWINFAWFASAYDTDDWVFRLLTMLQMVGVIILALGLPPMFASLNAGQTVDNRVMVLGYVVMRVAMVAHWLRAARADPVRRSACLTYVTSIAVAQVGWVLLLVANTGLAVTAAAGLFLILIEMSGPYVAERRKGGTPWHPHHIAERYGLLAIIALGEGIIGTVAALSAVVESQGWSVDAALIGVAGTGLTLGMWWMYFIAPAGEMLHRFRERSFGWGYGHILLFAAIAGTGAGLHVAAYYIEHQAKIGATAAVLSTVVPVALYVVMVFVLYTLLIRRVDAFHWWLLLATAVFLVAPVLLAQAGVSVVICLVVLTLAPAVTVVGYETIGHRHQAEALARIAAAD